MREAKLAVITNSFNRLDLMEQAVPSLLASLAGLPFSSVIVIFDAGSNDGSIEWIRAMASEHPAHHIHLIGPSSPGACSFADGCNQAIAYAVAQCPDLQWCLFYETDNQMPNLTALDTGIQFLTQHPKIGGVGFTVERLDGAKAGYGCRFPGILGFAVGQQLASLLNLDEPTGRQWKEDSDGRRWTLCDVVFTSPLLIRFQAWKETGPMDAASFPFTDSDVEWCWRARQSGWPMAVLDLPGVIHDNGGNASGWSVRRVLWFHQSRLRFLKRRLPLRGRLLKAVLYVRHSLEMIVLFLKRKGSVQAQQSLKTRIVLIKGLWNNYEKVLDR